MIDFIQRWQGESVYLRLLGGTDAPAFLRYRLDNREFLRPFEPAQPESHFTEEHIKSMLFRWAGDAEADLAYGFGIFDADSDELAGMIRLSQVARGPFQNAYLGYSIAERHNGKGWMSEAVRLMLDIAFGRLELHRVQANVMPRNAPSIRVLEKNGFRREGYSPLYLCINGVWEDHVNFAMTVEDYRGT